MSEKPFPHRGPYVCPVEATLDVIGGKWKGVILYYLHQQDVLRFGELRRLVPGATQQMLTKQLRELENDGVIHREVYREVPPKVEYSLTDLGRSLGPIVNLMCAWGKDFEAWTSLALTECEQLGEGASGASGSG